MNHYILKSWLQKSPHLGPTAHFALDPEYMGYSNLALLQTLQFTSVSSSALIQSTRQLQCYFYVLGVSSESHQSCLCSRNLWNQTHLRETLWTQVFFFLWKSDGSLLFSSSQLKSWCAVYFSSAALSWTPTLRSLFLEFTEVHSSIKSNCGVSVDTRWEFLISHSAMYLSFMHS